MGLALLWSGRKKVHLSGFASTLISVLDVVLLVAGVALLGSLGVGVFVAANVVAFAAVSVRLAMKQEEMLLYAGTQCGASKEEMYALSHWMQKESGPFAMMGPLERAQLISELAQRARSPEEIRQMALPIALLWVVHRPDLAWLVEQFDRLLRLYGLEADESMRVADNVSGASKASAATFKEMIDAMVAVATEEPAA